MYENLIFIKYISHMEVIKVNHATPDYVPNFKYPTGSVQIWPKKPNLFLKR